MTTTHTQEWHEKRRQGIGGSDWGDVLSIEPYGCQRRLWYEKRATPPDFEIVETGAMKRGTMMEPIVSDVFCEETGAEVRENPEYDKPKDLPSWWIGNLDREVIADSGDFDGFAGPGVAEYKTKAPWLLQEVKRNGVPPQEVAQVSHYIALTGWEWGAYFALDPLNFHRHHLAIFMRDKDLIKQMLTGGERFMRMVENGPAPDRLLPEDHRCQKCNWRLTCHGADIFVENPQPAPGDYEQLSDPKGEQLWQEHTELKGLVKDAKELLTGKKDEIRAHFKDSETKVIFDNGGKVIVSQRAGKQTFNVKQLRIDKPKIAEKYTGKGAPYWDVRTY